MYMQPITRAKAPASPRRRRLVGAPVLLASAAVMLPWLTVTLVFSGAVLGAQSLVRLPRLLLTMIDYAGAVALGD